MRVKSESEVAQLCPTLSDPMDCSPPGSSIHGIFQARVLEWGAIASSEGSSMDSDNFQKYYAKNFTHCFLGNERVLNIFGIMKLYVTNIGFVGVHRIYQKKRGSRSR